MVELKREELMKNRGYGALLSDALSLLSRNFKKIARHIWMFAVVYCAVTAYAVMRSIHLARTDVLADAGSTTEACTVLVLMLMTGVAFWSRAAMLLNGQTMRYNLIKTLKLLVFGLIVAVIIFAITTGLSWLTFFILHKSGTDLDFMQSATVIYLILLCVMTVAVFVLLPYSYVMMKYIMEPGTRLRKTVFGGYRSGLRHYGYIFITMLLLWIISCVVATVLSMPMLVLVIALGIAVGGTVIGDPLELPGYFYPMMYIVTFLTNIITAVVSLFQIFVIYYMYGSIEKRTEEKAGMMSKSKDKQNDYQP